MKMNIKSLLVGLAISTSLVGCGGSDGGGTATTISGVALKADGTVFAKNSVVLAVDENGNTGKGSVTDDAGSYLVSVASSGKKEKDVSGNKYLKVTEGTSDAYLVIPSDESNVNFNAITSAASQLIVDKTTLATIFTEVGKVAKDEKAVTSVDVLAALAKVQEITKTIFKSSATTVVSALFGNDSAGKVPFDVNQFLSGKDTKSVVILKAASSAAGSGVSAVDLALANAKTSTPTLLLNNSTFFSAIAKDLADDSAAAGTADFSNFLNSVLQTDALKTALKTLAETIDAYVLEVEKDTTKSLTATIPTTTTVVSATVTVARATGTATSDKVTYSVVGGVTGDTTEVSMAVLEGTAVQAIVTATLTFNGTVFTSTDAKATVTSGNTQITVSSTKAFATAGSIDLQAALADAKTALTANSATLGAKVPSTSVGLTLVVSATPISRSGAAISTLITSGTTTTTSVTGVTLK
jgi:hypothetical protein